MTMSDPIADMLTRIRNANTAKKYKSLGMADYAAMEAFKRYFF